MSSRNSRIVHNRLASQLLYRLLDWRKWDELKLAEVSGILPSVISAHLSGNRPIRPQHLAAYLRVLDRQERSALLDAWLQDNVRSEVAANLLEGTKTIRCGQSKRIDVECSIGGQRRSRATLRSLKSSVVSVPKPPSSVLCSSYHWWARPAFNSKVGCWRGLVACLRALSTLRLL